MSKGQLKTRIGLALGFALAMAACPACAVDATEAYPEDIEDQEPAVVSVQSLDPSSIERPESTGGTDDGPGGKNQTEETTSGASTDEEEEPDPDPWKLPSLPGDPGGGGDDEGSSGEDPP
jgi:hypothetical protein